MSSPLDRKHTMGSIWRSTFLVSLCTLVVACAEVRTYSHPSINDADDREVAILEELEPLAGIAHIKDADGNYIDCRQGHVRSPCPAKIKCARDDDGWCERFRLLPGEYEISYGWGYYGGWTTYGLARVTLKAGHVYRVESEYCYVLGFLFCPHMETKSGDVWLQDLTIGERIHGCRQGLGCVN